MASTYSPNLRLELIGAGEQQGTWGTTTNINLGTLLEEAIGGYVSVAVTDGADTTLTTNNGSADQSRNAVINLTGSLSAARTVICPAIEKTYIVRNATTGGFAVTFKVSGQTGVSIPNGSTCILYVNGNDAVLATGTIATQNSSNVSITGGSITGITDLAVADGGTGASTAAGAATNLGLGTGDSPVFSGLTTNGKTVLGNGPVSTTETTNLLYFPFCSGTPTGIPNFIAGHLPVVIDAESMILYAYINGSWTKLNTTPNDATADLGSETQGLALDFISNTYAMRTV